jgi:hypothetical protein
MHRNYCVRSGFGGLTVLVASRGDQVSCYTTEGVSSAGNAVYSLGKWCFALFARLEQSRHLALRLDVGRNARAGSSRFG